jgi:hypothetical protein
LQQASAPACTPRCFKAANSHPIKHPNTARSAGPGTRPACTNALTQARRNAPLAADPSSLAVPVLATASCAYRISTPRLTRLKEASWTTETGKINSKTSAMFPIATEQRNKTMLCWNPLLFRYGRPSEMHQETRLSTSNLISTSIPTILQKWQRGQEGNLQQWNAILRGEQNDEACAIIKSRK